MIILCILQLLLCPLRVFGDESVVSTVDALQRRYASVTTISSRFQQNYRAPGIDQTEGGLLWMKKPGLMCWEYKTPEEKLFVADGHKTYLYVPEDHQVLVRTFDANELHSTPLQFLLGKGDILASYAAAWETELKPKTQGDRMVRLTPRAAGAEYDYLVLELDPATLNLRRLVIRERSGNTSEFIFTDLKTNLKIEKRRFHFDVPKGVEVIQMDEK